MTESELAQIEAELSMRLPDDYRRIMLQYPFPPLSWPHQAEMSDSVIYLIQTNQDTRKQNDFGSVWKDDYFIFGCTSGGDAFVLDTSLSSWPVYRIDRSAKSVLKETGTLADWVDQRIECYVDFDRDQAQRKYESLTKALNGAGFFASKVEPMGGWDRVCPASKKSPDGGYTGNSFWVTKLETCWYLGTWGGFIYRLPSEDVLQECCVDWLRRKPDSTCFDFDGTFKKEYQLIEVPYEEFESAIG